MLDGNVYDYNWPAVICSQAVEKLLKSVIEKEFAEDSSCIAMMRTHNLRTIVAKIKTKYPDCTISSKDCKWLGDYYYDARCPGDDFVEVTKEDAEEAIQIVEDTMEAVGSILIDEQSQSMFQYAKEQVETMKS